MAEAKSLGELNPEQLMAEWWKDDPHNTAIASEIRRRLPLASEGAG